MKFEDIIKEQGYLVYTNVGVSMMPLIREGKDLVYIKKIDRPLKIFDAVLFRRPHIQGRGEYVLHRILKINKDHTYFIIGDNDFRGEIVKEENIFGILKSIKRGDKEISCDSLKYKLFVYLTWMSFPLRYLKKKMKKLIKRVKRKILSIIK